MKIFAFIARVIFGVLLALFMAEIAFRCLPSTQKIRWSDRPKEYYIPENAPNLQDGAYPRQKPANTFRIAVVGDSFSFAPHMQYDDAFSKRLERWLNLNSDSQKVEVMNMGISGYSTRHEVALVEKAVKDFSADLVILQITLNDAELQPLDSKAQKEMFGSAFLNKPIFRYWKSGKFFLERLQNTRTHSLYKQYFHDLFEKAETYSVFKQSLSNISDIATKHKVPVVSVLFPLFTFPMDANTYPFTDIHNKIQQDLSERKIPYLDLFNDYIGIPNDHLQIIPGKDSHPNEIAHRIAAESIYKWLRNEKIISSEFFAKRAYKSRKDLISKRIIAKDKKDNES